MLTAMPARCIRVGDLADCHGAVARVTEYQRTWGWVRLQLLTLDGVPIAWRLDPEECVTVRLDEDP